MIEEVKKILEEPDISGMDWELGKSILAQWKANLPQQICQLFEPKPDKARLLDREELMAVDDVCIREGIPATGKGSIRRLFKQLEAQRDLTTSIVDKQARQRESDMILLQLVERLGYEISEGRIVDDAKVLCEANFENLMRLVEQGVKQVRQEVVKKIDNEFQLDLKTGFLILSPDWWQELKRGVK